MADTASDAGVPRHQRLGAYGVLVRQDPDGVPHLLVTRVAPQSYPPAHWALPGGGVDHGESPDDALVREVYEEAGLKVTSFRLVDVHSYHRPWPNEERREDYHGVHLLYAIDVEGEGLVEPQVIEVGGSTDLAAWMPLADLPPLAQGPGPLLANLIYALERLDQF